MADELNRGGDIRIAHAHREPGNGNPDAIRHDIDDTRERMSHTIDEIGDRLNPDHIKAQVKQNVREATIGRAETMARHAADRVNETRNGMMDTIRDNPIPAAMVGIGLGWLMWNGRREHAMDRSDRYLGDWDRGELDRWETGTRGGMRARTDRMTDQVRDRAGRMADEAGDMADRTRDVVGNAMDRTEQAFSDTSDRAQELAVEFADRARYRANRVEDRLSEGVNDNPLAMGAAALALGLAAGLAAPATRTETEVMGRARDQLSDRVRGMAHQAEHRVQDVAGRMMHQAKDTMRSAAKEGMSSGSETTSRPGTGTGTTSQGGYGAGSSQGTSNRPMAAGPSEGAGRPSQGRGASGPTTSSQGMGGSANMPGQMQGQQAQGQGSLQQGTSTSTGTGTNRSPGADRSR